MHWLICFKLKIKLEILHDMLNIACLLHYKIKLYY